MTTEVDIVNRALQVMGTRTTVASLSEQSNEATQADLIIDKLRDELLRMAPWDCAFNYNTLTFITSQPGTPENANSTQTVWAKGLPAPPWAYEYQYPADCLRACFIVPQFNTGATISGVPIFPTVTGGVPAFWNGPAVKFKVSIDQFFGATAVAIAGGGTGYAAQEIITLEEPSSGLGAPAQVRVLTVNGSGVILTCELVTSVIDTTIAGSYFEAPTNPVAQDSTTGSGTGATFNLTMQTQQASQRVILTNQSDAIMAYIKQVTDPNIMDPLFQDAWINILGARLCMALTGDKALANMLTQGANAMIVEARKADGNEGLTVNDVTPDFIRVRGYSSPDSYSWPNFGMDWGPMFALMS